MVWKVPFELVFNLTYFHQDLLQLIRIKTVFLHDLNGELLVHCQTPIHLLRLDRVVLDL